MPFIACPASVDGGNDRACLIRLARGGALHRSYALTARLNRKVALVTGAARGIGAAIARAFVDEGAIVWVTDVDAAAAAALAAELGRMRALRHSMWAKRSIGKRRLRR